MTVRFLTQKEITHYRKVLNWDKPQKYDWHILNPLLSYDLIGYIEDFPDCCGASVLNGFNFRNARKNAKLSEKEAAAVCLNINNQLKAANKIIIAMLNEPQQRIYKGIFERFGGEQFGVPTAGHHRRKIYPWVFIKGEPRKTKRVFT